MPDYDISIYHDARIILDSKIIKELNKFNGNFDLISVKHRDRKTFTEELFTCFINKKINFREFKHIKSFAKKIISIQYQTKILSYLRMDC